MNRSSGNLERIQEKIGKYMHDGAYYEAQQLIKTLSSRLVTQNRCNDAIMLLSAGTLKLLEHKQDNSACELVECLLKAFDKSSSQFSEKCEVIEKLFHSFYHSETNAKAKMMKSAIKWSKSEEKIPPRGHFRFHNLLASYYWKDCMDFVSSQKHFLKGDCIPEHVLMLSDWAIVGLASEMDLFLLRTVCQYLCLNRYDKGSSFCQAFVLHHPQLNTPLVHFANLLLKSVEFNAEKSFKMLLARYKPFLMKDDRLQSDLSRIGQIYFDIQDSGAGFLGNMIKNMLSSNTTEQQ